MKTRLLYDYVLFLIDFLQLDCEKKSSDNCNGSGFCVSGTVFLPWDF